MPAHTKPRCTICGKACPVTDTGAPRWSRGLYAHLGEPRCSQAHAARPITMPDVQHVLEAQGARVLSIGEAPAGDLAACPTCRRPFPTSPPTPLRVCWECKRQIRKGDKWHIRQEDQRIVHRNCKNPESYR